MNYQKLHKWVEIFEEKPTNLTVQVMGGKTPEIIRHFDYVKEELQELFMAKVNKVL
jgi:hypothetical protein